MFSVFPPEVLICTSALPVPLLISVTVGCSDSHSSEQVKENIANDATMNNRNILIFILIFLSIIARFPHLDLYR
jgi:hypothetical protein